MKNDRILTEKENWARRYDKKRCEEKKEKRERK